MFGPNPTVTQTRVNNKDGTIAKITTRTWPSGRYYKTIETLEPDGLFSMRTVQTTKEEGHN